MPSIRHSLDGVNDCRSLYYSVKRTSHCSLFSLHRSIGPHSLHSLLSFFESKCEIYGMNKSLAGRIRLCRGKLGY